MRILIDILLILIATVTMLHSLYLIVRFRSRSIADYGILLIYIFQCVPVFCDLIIGIPKYPLYFSCFDRALKNNIVALIYNIYVISLLIALTLLSNRRRKLTRRIDEQPILYTDTNFGKVPEWFLLVLAFIPFLHILISGNLASYVIYGSATHRGLSSDFAEWNSIFVIVSIMSLTLLYFKKEATFRRKMIYFVLTFFNIWASGKRYTVITVLFSYIYMFSLRRRYGKKRNKLLLMIVMAAIGIVIYAGYYLISVRGVSSQLQVIYSALRVDFGRDDVVKFSIMRELLEGEPILDYPGQTVISTLFMIVPRVIFPWKPYPHYRYLTAAIYNVPLLEIPSGMTPTLLEMTISNFQWLGIPICILFLCWYCNVVDQERSGEKKYIYAIVLMGLLSQSMDAMWPIFYIALFFILTRRFRFIFNRKRFSFTLNGKRWR